VQKYCGSKTIMKMFSHSNIAHLNCEILITNVKVVQMIYMSSVLQLIWHHIDVVERCVTFLPTRYCK